MVRRFLSYQKYKTIKYSNPNTLTKSSGESLSNSFNSFRTNTLQSNSILNTSTIKGHFLKKKGKYKYKGYFLYDKKTKNNFGIISWLDGSEIKSKFNLNKISGYAKFYNAVNDSVFEGHYISNYPEGFGIYTEKNKTVTYEGVWTNESLNGIGTELWKDETFYRGEYVDCKKQGIGLYKWPDGTIYQGEWNNDQMTGYCIIIYPDDRMYYGEVENGLMNGYGEFTWPDGKKYIGYYVNNVKEGFGIFIWNFKNLEAFIGFWVEGKMDGPGMKINERGVKYGIWKNGYKKKWLQGAWEMEDRYLNEKLDYQIHSIKIFEKDFTFLKNYLLKFSKI